MSDDALLQALQTIIEKHSMGGDFKVDVTSEGRRHFLAAFALAFSQHHKATHWRVVDRKLVLFWMKDPEAAALPFEMPFTAAVNFTWDWLQAQPEENYGPVPDFDGSARQGWRIESHQGGWSTAFVSIQPAWMCYGK